jgi:hypothetical protein
MMHDKITCDFCGSIFRPRVPGQRFDTPGCSQAWHTENRRRAVAAYNEQQQAKQQQVYSEAAE